MTQRRILVFFLAVVFIISSTYFVIKLAKGYKLDLNTKAFRPTGLLVATSIPDGAQVYVDGELKSATNTTISLSPETYKVEIKKDGFLPWQKNYKIEKELVAKTGAYLFPSVPTLKSLTYTGALNPVISPDGSKVVYFVPLTEEKSGFWIMDLSDFPFGISHEPRQITKNILRGQDYSKATYRWSPDSKQILVTLKKGKIEENYLLDSNSLVDQKDFSDITIGLPSTFQDWNKEQKTRDEQKLKRLPSPLLIVLKTRAADVAFSPDENMIFYTATDSAQLPNEMISPILGASTQKQERSIKKNQIYVYDIKEDRNFWIMENSNCTTEERIFFFQRIGKGESKCDIRWFPTSAHLFLVEKDKVTIIDYDGVNRQAAYSGPFEGLSAFPFQGANKIMILTNLSPEVKTSSNLYAVILR